MCTLPARLPSGVRLMQAGHRGLLALQGPKAAEVLARHCPDTADMPFMSGKSTLFDGIEVHVSRSGYTGEDGYEISVKAKRLEQVADALLAEPEVKPIGLGARDSLRLEAGLCLYGHDIDTGTSPVEAALVWSMQKRRREEGGFPGAARIQRELAEGPARIRVGLLPEGRAPAREGTVITTPDGRPVGVVTSGGFGPSLNGPLAMGYVEPAHSAIGTELALQVRGKALPARVCRHAVRAQPLFPQARLILIFPQEHSMAETRYTKDHEYIRVDGDTGTVGITDYAQSQLGDVVFVELPDVGKSVAKGGEAAVVESVKAASEVYAPVSGEIVEVNTVLADTPATVNDDPKGQGWFVKLKLKDASELEGLMTEDQYNDYIANL